MTDSPPLVTIAVATYNAAEHLDAAIASALNQTLRDIEVIAVDDCSSDDTVARLERIAARDDRLIVERLTVNGGPAAARNAALRRARGRWFAVLDSDDLFAPDRLERLIAAATAQGADIIADDLVVFSGDGSVPPSLHLDIGSAGRWLTLDEYLAQSRMFGGGFDPGYLKPVITLDRLRAAGLCYDEQLRIGEDDDLVLRMLLAGMRYWIEPIPTYAYRKHAASISHRLSAANARAMHRAATELVAAASESAALPALEHRAAALERSWAFARMIDALKAKRPGAFAAIALRHPRALALLRLPLAAAWRRRFPARATSRVPENPIAVAALRGIMPPADR